MTAITNSESCDGAYILTNLHSLVAESEAQVARVARVAVAAVVINIIVEIV